MKNIWKRMLTSVLLAATLLATVAVTACADTDEPPVDPTPTGEVSVTPTGSENTPTPTADPNKRIDLDLPVKDYGGLEFHVLEWSANGQNTAGSGWIPWDEIYVKDYEGDAIAQEVFERDSTVEEKYKVHISQEYVSVDQGLQQKLQIDASTSENSYQLLTHRSFDVISLIQADLLADLNDYANYLHYDKPWWASDSVESLTLGDHLYVASSELTLRDKGATAVMYFNPTLAKNYEDLPNFYELADNKQWTMESMIDAAELVSGSLDGDDLMNSTRDMWGMTCGVDAIYFFFNGAGFKFGVIDREGLLDYQYGGEDSITAVKHILDDVLYADWYFNPHTETIAGNGSIFTDDFCLFNPGLVQNCKGLIGMESDYGILPMPLYDEDQEEYSSLVWQHYDCLVGIPASTDDPEMSAIILEALSYESYYTVYPQFYNEVLMNRAARDADSVRMLKKVFETRSYDPGQIWDFDSGLHGNDGILWSPRTRNSDMASIWAKYKDVVEKGVDKINNWILYR